MYGFRKQASEHTFWLFASSLIYKTMLTGTNLQFANSYNNRIILETIRLYGPLSRVGIARLTQLTAQTVTNITKKLLQAGLIVEDSRKQDGPGAPSILLRVNENAAYSIGIDFDKDHLTAILVNFSGKIRQKITMDMDFPSPYETIEEMERMVKELIERHGIDLDLIWGVGIGVPGPLVVSKGSTLKNTINPKAMPGWENVPIVSELESRLHLPVVLENNASAAAIGEFWYGDGKHMKSFFYVYFGAGLGGGLVLGGQLYSGYTGNAGELGYFPTPVLQGGASSGVPDHLGEYFNIPRLYEQLRQKNFPVSSLRDLERLFLGDNAHVKEWIDAGSGALLPLILAIEYLIDPEAIFFGGRLPEPLLVSLLEKLEGSMPEHRTDQKPVRPEFRIASAGEDAAAMGVATIPLYTSFAPIPKVIMKTKGPLSDTFARAHR